MGVSDLGVSGAGHSDASSGATSGVLCHVNIACDSVRREGGVVVGVSLPSALMKVWGHAVGNGGTTEVTGKGSLAVCRGKSLGPPAEAANGNDRARRTARLSIPVEAQIRKRKKEIFEVYYLSRGVYWEMRGSLVKYVKGRSNSSHF